MNVSEKIGFKENLNENDSAFLKNLKFFEFLGILETMIKIPLLNNND